VALLRPGHREEFAFAAEQETWHRWISVRTEPLNEEALRFWEALPDMLPLTERMNHITDLMLSLQGNDREQNQEALSALGQAAILLYVAECRMQEAQRSSHPSVLRSKIFISRSYREELALPQLAEAANVTPEHLIRLFRKYEGVTPAQYLWNYRIERGLNLLRNTGLSVGEIAEQCGFKTSYHFARSIKRHMGMTPTEVRNQSWLGGHGQGK
jgi:AraC family transcriptional regulator of arabinose operon